MKSILVLIALAVASCSGCNQVPVIANAVIDCTGSHAGDISTLYAALKAKLAGGGSWTDIENAAITAGKEVGGCALAELVNDYVGGRAGPKADGNVALATLEDFRSKYAGNASFKTPQGNL